MDPSYRPIVGRLAGLPGELLERFGQSGEKGTPIFLELLVVEEQLTRLRSSLIEAIEGGLTRFPPESRRFLLKVKRSCFNGREIHPLRNHGQWADLLDLSGTLVELIAEREQRSAEIGQILERRFAENLHRERRLVVGLLADRRFLRGVAIGKADLVQLARIKAKALEAANFRPVLAKWELSLARYATRAAGKLSINSTLTSYCMGRAVEAPNPAAALRLPLPAEGERSLVRMNRHEIEHFQFLLLRDPRFKKYLRVAWNDSVEEPEPGQYRFLRDAYWSFEPGASDFEVIAPARIKVRLQNGSLEAARGCLAGGSCRHEVLVRRICQDEERPATEVEAEIDQLLEVGVLIAQPPWSIGEAWLEAVMARHLHGLKDPALQPYSLALDELLELERSFAAAGRPEEHMELMKGAVLRLMKTAGAAPHVVEHLRKRTQFFEDVLFCPATPRERPGGLEIATTEVERLLESSNLVLRFAGLFNYRHDVLHTLAGWWRESSAGRARIPFLELAKSFAPIWKQYPAAHRAANEGVLTTFDPLRLGSLAALRELRKSLIDGSTERLLASPDRDRLTAGDLQALLQGLPTRYAPMVGAGIFVQPLADGEGWVMNQISEGTGRYLSRVTPVLEQDERRKLVDHLVAGSSFQVDGEDAQTLEVLYPWGNLVSAHEPHSRLVLDLRGLNLDLPAERKIRLEDLSVCADLEQETFRLVDHRGRRLLPVHLCSMVDAGLPLLLRFLLMFGPGETRGVFPLAVAEGDDDKRCYRRVTCGKLVVRRKSWSVAVDRLKASLAGLGEYRTYLEVNRWWRRQGLPPEAYYLESTFNGRAKPQYIHVGSGLLCSLFAASLQKKKSRHLIVDEALPAPKDFPMDAGRQRRGVELLIDAMAVRADPGSIPGGT